MTVSSQQPSTLNGRPQYEPCEECGAPLDPQQRYCVNCAARRGNGANPASRYFATMSKRAHRSPLRAPAKSGASNSRAAAVGFFALLPIAVAIGVVVGRSGNDSGENEALLEALRNRPAAVASTAAGTTGAAANSAKGKKAKAAAAKSSKGAGKALAKTSNGTVHEVGAGYKPPAKKVEEDTRLVEENPEQVGSNYIKAQQNIPDVVVVGGDPSEAPASSGKAGEP